MAQRGIDPVVLSSVWETEPVECRDPLWFLNLVARVRTGLAAHQVLDALMEIEREAGRVRREANEPRPLDLDLLMLGDLRSTGPRLVLPHPRMWNRRFVLAPLAEVAPDLRHPDTGRTVAETARALGPAPEVRRVGILAVPDERSL